MTKKGMEGANARFFPPFLLAISLVLSSILEVFFFSFSVFEGSFIQLAIGLILVCIALGTVFYTLKIFWANQENPHPKSLQNQLFLGATFNFTRNPIYLSMIFILIGCGIAFNSVWYLIFSVIAFFLLHFGVVIPEEKYLEKEFGTVYLEYKKSVRRWL
tara:strand:+ start:2869 stop:3345 length:477 start_codon:yes stop_codon:yes gene_type:complete